MVGAEKWGFPGSLALRAEGEEKVAPWLQSSGREQGEDHLPCGSRVGSALQNDQLTRTEPLCDGPARVDYIRQVGLAGVGQWSRDTDNDHIRLIESRKEVVASKRCSRIRLIVESGMWPM